MVSPIRRICSKILSDDLGKCYHPKRRIGYLFTFCISFLYQIKIKVTIPYGIWYFFLQRVYTYLCSKTQSSFTVVCRFPELSSLVSKLLYCFSSALSNGRNRLIVIGESITLPFLSKLSSFQDRCFPYLWLPLEYQNFLLKSHICNTFQIAMFILFVLLPFGFLFEIFAILPIEYEVMSMVLC